LRQETELGWFFTYLLIGVGVSRTLGGSTSVNLFYIQPQEIEKFGVLLMSDTTKVTQSIANERNAWHWGFNPQSEIWNGRLAMIGFLAIILIEAFSGQGFLHFWSIL
jgi:hypothetical protein